MADRPPPRSRSGNMGWIIGGIVVVAVLLFVVFSFGNRSATDDGLETAPAIDEPATDPAPEPDPEPEIVE